MIQHLGVDVVVVGAGPAGSAAAAYAARAGWSVLLVERSTGPRSKPCSEYVGPGAEPVLTALGLGERLGVDLGQRLIGMEIVTRSGARHLSAYAADSGQRFAYSIPRARLDGALVQSAETSGAIVRWGLRVRELVHCRGAVCGVRGETLDGATVHIDAHIVIGADGRGSTIRTLLGAQRRPQGIQRLGLSARFEGLEWPEPYGRMYVGRRGYVGVAPGGDDCLVVGAAVEPPRTRQSAQELFRLALEEHPELHRRVADGRLVDRIRGVTPLAARSSVLACPGVLLVGDAAESVDPFTGEGITRALITGRLAGLAADAALRAHSYAPLAWYVRQRSSALATKNRLLEVIQLGLQYPAVMDCALARLNREETIGPLLANALGDLVPAAQLCAPSVLWKLLRP